MDAKRPLPAQRERQHNAGSKLKPLLITQFKLKSLVQTPNPNLTLTPTLTR